MMAAVDASCPPNPVPVLVESPAPVPGGGSGVIVVSKLPMPLPGGGILSFGGGGAVFRSGDGLKGVQLRQTSGSSGAHKFVSALEREVRQLNNLADNWDGEGAPKPDDASVADAAQIIGAAALDGVQPSSVDPDVLGGVGLYFDSPTGEHAWVSLMNTGLRAVLFAYKGKRIATVAVTPEESWPRIKKFLAGDHSVGEV